MPKYGATTPIHKGILGQEWALWMIYSTVMLESWSHQCSWELSLFKKVEEITEAWSGFSIYNVHITFLVSSWGKSIPQNSWGSGRSMSLMCKSTNPESPPLSGLTPQGTLQSAFHIRECTCKHSTNHRLKIFNCTCTEHVQNFFLS